MKKKIAFLFPGQGAQYVGMGKDFYHTFNEAKSIFEEAQDLLHRNLTKVIFDGPIEKLTETREAQVAIYITSLAIGSVLSKKFPELKPECCAGLSLGEYTALTFSGRLSFRDTLPLVQYRGECMNEACVTHEGSMAVILGLNGEEVEKMVRDLALPHDLWTANFNSPGQVVISGTKKGIEAGTIKAKEIGAKRVLPLQVHGAFHSGLMKEAEEKLSHEINRTSIIDSQIELVMNVPGSAVKDLGSIRKFLIQQVTHSVRWEQSIRYMETKPIDLYVEIGCGKTLAGLNKRNEVVAPTLTIEKVEDLETLEQWMMNAKTS